MADDDLDLEDDDLDLGGDDFAGELDDMMGDDELGGDTGGGGGGGGGDDSDSELDSFFEDLSSIEDMDDSVSESAPAAAAAVSSGANEEKAPARSKKAAPKDKKKGGKFKYVVLLILLLAGGAGAYWWYFMRPPEIVMEEEPTMVESPPIQTIEIEKPTIRKLPVQQPVVMEPPPAPAKPVAPQKRYLVQVATCTYELCKQDFADTLRGIGEPVFQRNSGEKYDFIELVSSQVFTYREAGDFVSEINQKNNLAGKASIKSQSNGYRVSMGLFPALDRAKETKNSIEKIFPRKTITLNMEHVRKDYTTTKIFAGPYNSRSEAKKVLMALKTNEKFNGAFVVLY